jgi:nitronate monooxygenase
MRDEQLRAVADSSVRAVTFFWVDPLEHTSTIKLMRNSGTKVIWQCGSVEEARNAKAAEVDVVMAQGFEAGGHVRGNVATFVLIPEVRDAIGDMPLIAAGGIADGRGLAAALALGADGAAIGTRFIASTECSAHPQYKHRILNAGATDTLHTTLFDREWPDAPIRALRTKVVEEWERAGRPAAGMRPGEGQAIGRLNRSEIEFGREFFKYGGIPPADYVEGDIESFPFASGQSVSLVRETLPAGEIVRRIVAEASAVIKKQLDMVGYHRE